MKGKSINMEMQNENSFGQKAAIARLNKIKLAAQQHIDEILLLTNKAQVGKASFIQRCNKLNELLRPGCSSGWRKVDSASPLSMMAEKAICNLNYIGNGAHCDWFNLTFSQSKLKKMPQFLQATISQWVQDCEETVKSVIEKDEYNFYSAAFNNWADWYIQGASCLKVDWVSEREENTDIVFSNVDMNNITLFCEDWGEITSVMYTYGLSKAEAYNKYGIENITTNVKQALEEYNQNNGGVENSELKYFIDITFKRDQYKEWQKQIKTPYIRLIIDQNERRIVLVSEEMSLPYIVSRLYYSGTLPYGRSPIFGAYRDLVYYNELCAMEHTHLMYSSNPIFLSSAEFHTEHPDLKHIPPGGILRALEGNTLRPMIQPMFPTTNMSMIIQLKQILYASLVDQLMAQDIIPPNANAMTATEVTKREIQWNKRMLPLLESRKIDFFSPLIQRIMYLLGSANLLPEFPEEALQIIYPEKDISTNGINMLCKDLNIQFGGLLKNMSQKQLLDDLIAFVSTSIQFGLGELIEPMNVLGKVKEYMNIPNECMKSEEQVIQEQQQKAQAALQQQQEQELARSLS